jgi:hypothetical protein
VNVPEPASPAGELSPVQRGAITRDELVAVGALLDLARVHAETLAALSKKRAELDGASDGHDPWTASLIDEHADEVLMEMGGPLYVELERAGVDYEVKRALERLPSEDDLRRGTDGTSPKLLAFLRELVRARTLSESWFWKLVRVSDVLAIVTPEVERAIKDARDARVDAERAGVITTIGRAKTAANLQKQKTFDALRMHKTAMRNVFKGVIYGEGFDETRFDSTWKQLTRDEDARRKAKGETVTPNEAREFVVKDVRHGYERRLPS